MANNNDCIKNWHEEKGDGQFTAKSNKPQSLDWWAAKVKEGRQLTTPIPNIKNTLIAFNNHKIIKGNTNGLFDQMFIGVYQNTNFSLYLDVTSTVNQIVKKAINETEEMTKDPLFRTSQGVLDFLTSLGLYLITSSVHTNEVTAITTKFLKGVSLGKLISWPASLITTGIISISAGVHIYNFMYKSKWADNVKHKGRWDFKHNQTPFNKVQEGATSRFFHYKGHKKSYKLHNAGQTQVQGLLRYDDPGNICYAATGKILLSSLDGIIEKWLLEEFADMYALLSEPQYAHLSDKTLELIGTYLAKGGLISNLDNSWDLAAIRYGYDAF